MSRLPQFVRRLRFRLSLGAYVWVGILVAFLAACYGLLPPDVPGWIQKLLGLACASLAAAAYLRATKQPDFHDDLLARMHHGQHLDFGRQLRAEKRERRKIRLPWIGETTLRPVGAGVVFMGTMLWWLTPLAPVAVTETALRDLGGPLVEEIVSLRLVFPDGQTPLAEPPIVPIEARRLARKMPDRAGTFSLALRAIARSDFDEAKRLLVAAIGEEKVASAQIHAARAMAEMYAGNFADAAVWYRNALLARPTDPGLLCQAAVAAIQAGDYVNAMRLLLRATAAARREDGKSKLPLATCLHLHAALNVLAGRRPDQARAYNKQAQELFSGELGPESPRVAASLNNESIFYALAGSFPTARSLNNSAVEIWRRYDEKDPRTATGLANRATCFYLEGFYGPARESSDHALILRRNTVRPKTAVIVLTMTGAASIDLALARYDKARPPNVKSLVAALEKTLGRRHPGTAVAMMAVAKSYMAESLYAPAENYQVQALEILRESLGPESIYLVGALADLAEIQLLRGRDEDAEESCLAALRIANEGLDENHPLVARCLAVRGRVCLARGDPDQARRCFDQAIAVSRARYTEASPRLADVLALAASLENTPNTYQTGVASYQQALRIYESALGESSATHPAVAELSFGLARLYLRVGKHADAEPYLTRSMRIREKLLAPFHPALAETLEAEAEMLRHLDKPDDARAADLQRRAERIREEHAKANRREETPPL